MLGINRRTLVVKCLYFLYFLGWGAFHPLLSVTLKDKGLSDRNVGFMIGAYSLSRILAGPVWTSAIDAHPRHAAEIFGATALVCGVASAAFIHIESLPAALPLLIVYYIAETGHLPLMDTLTTTYLGETGADWGPQRLWGSLSWGIGVPLAGALYDTQHAVLSELPPYIMLFCFAGVYLCMRQGHLVESYAKQRGVAGGVVEAGTTEGTSIVEAVSLYASPRLAFLLATMMLLTSGIILVMTYTFLYLESLGAGKTLIGVCVAVSVSSEIPCFLIAGWVLRTIGIHRTLLLAGSCMVLRYLLYAVITEPLHAVFIEVLHGPTYAFGWSTALAYITEVSPPGGTTTMLGILCAVCWGVGPLLFTSLGGFVYDGVSPRFLFVGYALLVAAVVGLHWALSVMVPDVFALRCAAGGDEGLGDLQGRGVAVVETASVSILTESGDGAEGGVPAASPLSAAECRSVGVGDVGSAYARLPVEETSGVGGVVLGSAGGVSCGDAVSCAEMQAHAQRDPEESCGV